MYFWYIISLALMHVYVHAEKSKYDSSTYVITLRKGVQSGDHSLQALFQSLRSRTDVTLLNHGGRTVKVRAHSTASVVWIHRLPHEFDSVSSVHQLKRHQRDAPLAANVVPNQHIVMLKDTPERDQAALDIASSLTTRYGISVLKTYKIGSFRALLVQATYVQVNTVLAGVHLANIVGHQSENQAQDPLENIAEIQPNIIMHLASNNEACIEQDSGMTLWGLSRIAMRDREGYLGKTYPYSYNDNGTGVVVYVMDSGIYLAHTEFEEGRAIWGYTSPDLNEGDYDHHGHGTHVSGTIGGLTYGVAKNVELVAVKVLDTYGTGPASALFDGMQWAMVDYESRNRPPTIWSMSIGANGTFDYGGLFGAAKDAGITVVVAAGNENSNACLQTPAYLPETITVGSSDGQDRYSSFSNYGSCVDIIAPGENIISAGIESPTSYAIKSGTSMATPHVSGVVARYLSGLNYIPTPDEIKAWLISTSTKNAVSFYYGFQESTDNNLLYIHAECLTDGGSNSTTTTTATVTTTPTSMHLTTSSFCKLFSMTCSANACYHSMNLILIGIILTI